MPQINPKCPGTISKENGPNTPCMSTNNVLVHMNFRSPSWRRRCNDCGKDWPAWSPPVQSAQSTQEED